MTDCRGRRVWWRHRQSDREGQPSIWALASGPLSSSLRSRTDNSHKHFFPFLSSSNEHQQTIIRTKLFSTVSSSILIDWKYLKKWEFFFLKIFNYDGEHVEGSPATNLKQHDCDIFYLFISLYYTTNLNKNKMENYNPRLFLLRLLFLLTVRSFLKVKKVWRSDGGMAA